MKYNKTNQNLLVYFLFVLCLLNIIATAYLFLKINRKESDIPVVKNRLLPLPKTLSSKQQKMLLFEKLTSLYNQQKFNELYRFFDDTLKMKYDSVKFKETFQNLYNFSGIINKGAFSYYKSDENEYLKEYKLHYVIETAKGKMKLIINIRQQDDEEYSIIGFKITS